MSQNTVKQAIQAIPGIEEKPLIEVFRSWMVLTDLSFQDLLHVNYQDAVDSLKEVHDKTQYVLDTMDEDQLQETACRILKAITLYGDPILDENEEFSVPRKCTLTWDGTNWAWITDPKLRLRATAPSYKEALKSARALLEIEVE